MESNYKMMNLMKLKTKSKNIKNMPWKIIEN